MPTPVQALSSPPEPRKPKKGCQTLVPRPSPSSPFPCFKSVAPRQGRRGEARGHVACLPDGGGSPQSSFAEHNGAKSLCVSKHVKQWHETTVWGKWNWLKSMWMEVPALFSVIVSFQPFFASCPMPTPCPEQAVLLSLSFSCHIRLPNIQFVGLQFQHEPDPLNAHTYLMAHVKFGCPFWEKLPSLPGCPCGP